MKPPALFLRDERARERLFGFFTANIRNKNTRPAYYKAVCRFQSGNDSDKSFYCVRAATAWDAERDAWRSWRRIMNNHKLRQSYYTFHYIA